MVCCFLRINGYSKFKAGKQYNSLLPEMKRDKCGNVDKLFKEGS
jgi:hypothetical protein